MSKSKGTFIPARIYLNHLDATYMRYYLACKMGSGIDDFDFSYDDFTQRVNSDLIGKITNIASRGAQMTQKRLDGKMGVLPADGQELIAAIRAESDKIADLYEKRNFGKVMLAVRDLATLTNKYFDEREPWKTIKDDPETVRGILTTILNAFRLMAIYLKPILPSYVAKVEALFKEDPYTWDSLQTIVENTELAPFSHLAARIDRGLLDKITDETKEVYGVAGAEAAAAKEQKGGKKVEKTTEGDASQDTKWITFDEFAKVQLRVGKVIEAAEVPKANKLLQLTVDVGEDKPRNIFSGIKAWYEPADLVGKKVVVVTNLAPRKMKFGMSEGMVIASGDKDVKVLFADASALPGDEVS